MFSISSPPVSGAEGSTGSELSIRIERAWQAATTALLQQQTELGVWTGELSASALSTATAVTALALARNAQDEIGRFDPLIERGFEWLIRHQNPDGGWGDTTKSISNISTTTLVWSALALHRGSDPATFAAVAGAERWLLQAAGGLEPARIVEAIERRYGRDRTFSIPILTMAALCGRLGTERDAWGRVMQLPFEVAALPQRWFGALRLPVVSYALPALIAIGQVRHAKAPTRNLLLRWLRERCRSRTLEKLERLQPSNGGFLEATPLTSFVTMSLAAMGCGTHPVTRRGVEFLMASARPDGSWPIDTNLATWVTTLSVNALSAGTPVAEWSTEQRTATTRWLCAQQYRTEHPYTLAAPGGWAWTNLPGGVPDADDTAGAILALHGLGRDDASACEKMRAGAEWLLGLQNRDGGVPTFCRGWGRLPFDRSSPDITAHAIRGWSAVRNNAPVRLAARLDVAIGRAAKFLLQTQRTDGAWVPLWFGHQHGVDDENPLYGTARVVPALIGLIDDRRVPLEDALTRAVEWLVRAQNADGGWSGAAGSASSVEETGLALEALALVCEAHKRGALRTATNDALESVIKRGATWLVDAIERQGWREPAPIGFYFAKLWYFERLYPLIFATGALGRLTAPAARGLASFD